MNKLAVIFILSTFLAGCSTVNPLKILVPLPPIKHTLPPKPDLPVNHLTKNSQPDEIAKAYVATVYVQGQWIDQFYKTN